MRATPGSASSARDRELLGAVQIARDLARRARVARAPPRGRSRAWRANAPSRGRRTATSTWPRSKWRAATARTSRLERRQLARQPRPDLEVARVHAAHLGGQAVGAVRAAEAGHRAAHVRRASPLNAGAPARRARAGRARPRRAASARCANAITSSMPSSSRTLASKPSVRLREAGIGEAVADVAGAELLGDLGRDRDAEPRGEQLRDAADRGRPPGAHVADAPAAGLAAQRRRGSRARCRRRARSRGSAGRPRSRAADCRCAVAS